MSATRSKAKTKVPTQPPAGSEALRTKVRAAAPKSTAIEVTHDRKAARTLTGNDIRMVRTVRLGWSTQEFAGFLDVALSAIGRWERCGDNPVVTDRHFYNLLLVLVDVLDHVPDAKEKLSRVKNSGTHRGIYVMFGLHFGDTPWVDEERRSIDSVRVLKRAPAAPAQ